jgi:hypothetical protein
LQLLRQVVGEGEIDVEEEGEEVLLQQQVPPKSDPDEVKSDPDAVMVDENGPDEVKSDPEEVMVSEAN